MSGVLLGCIADDFTGATDLANNLVRAGMRTVQMIGVPAAQAACPPADAVVIALKSRTTPTHDAVAQSLAALRWLQAQGARQIYFKYCSTFDSTPAGNIGPVTDALLDALHGAQQGFSIACPAFPTNRRTVYQGHLFVGEQLLCESGMRDHPLTPMTDANLVRVMQAQCQRRVGLVPLDVVRRGSLAITERFDALRRDGIGVAIVDAVDDADLSLLGRALDGMPLVTGGSGVAIGLPQNWRAEGLLSDGRDVDHLTPPRGTQAVISGSCSQATQAQVARFLAQELPAFAIDPLALAAGADVVAAALAWARPKLAAGPVLIYATADAAAVRSVQSALGVARAGELVEHALADIARGLVQAGVGQLVVAGGETSGAVVQALGITQMQIGSQIDPGVPWTAASASASDADAGETGGSLVHLALKSGNFGREDFFTAAFAALAQE